MAENSYDIAVVGGGPGGYVAAIRASQLGFKTAVVEREHLGGICLNWGCIPTKALLRVSEVNHILSELDKFGFTAKDVSFDVSKVVKYSRDTAKTLTQGVTHLLKKNKVDVIDGHGKLAGKGKVAVEKDGKKVADVQAKHIILATGARARALPNVEPDGKVIWTYKEAMVPKAMPKKLLVIGSGAIGMEFASFYSDMGVDVTVAEVVDRILPAEDEEISDFAKKSFEKKGMKIHTGAKVTGVKTNKNGATAKIETAKGKTEEIQVDNIVLAVGIVGNVENIGLDSTNIKVEKSHIVVDEWLRTGEPNVYAIGDLVGPPWLAHKASHEGVICVEKIAGLNDVHPLDTSRVPGCTYCRPQVASVGMTEKEAKEKGHKLKVGRFPYRGNGKALALGETEGMVKTIFDEKTGELLGAHMIGAEVTELIQGYAVAQTLETTETDLMHTIFPHPTLSEMMHESVLDAYGRAIHF
ncbi:dihydrolipoyl dehydrogenase [Ferruginivarius sediminum]|uniref:Dihydrolipoyl dehydrogenase n=1 Tax=Ferruginivarius sediminum TaxID=2661937 RepID=A0A369TCH0_9PROT|nr:dihydrolipoyl dehydrogenase [Ferruginivarius sediminum]RDD62105.1 dihydrolipoyl dehydrogenase [Ferruginivarius sediminum]